jgi:hypothetical protein
MRHNPGGWNAEEEEEVEFDYDECDLREAAINGDSNELEYAGKSNPDALHDPDDLGWRPLHEAVRAGQVKHDETYLPCNLHSSLHLEYLGGNHEMTKFL